jgi:protein phosphatase
MKIVIISDVHGNYDALSHLPEDYDQLWVLGDLVNYGPQPGEVISFVRKHAAHVVRGNHDHCVGFGEMPCCSPRFREMAETTWRYTAAVLNEEDKHYLQSLPLYVDVWVGKMRCRLCHAPASDPPLTNGQSRVEQLDDECRRVGAEVLLVGGGHECFGRKVGSMLLANPGSLGQPRAGEPVASYAVLKDGKLSLRSFRYPVILRTGLVPRESGQIISVGNITSERCQFNAVGRKD